MAKKVVTIEDQILQELKLFRQVMSEVIGSSDLPANQRFSKEAVSKAAKEYQKMLIERGEWITDISKVIRNAPWYSGKVIIEKFGFTNYFKRGSNLYFNRKDLMELNKDLKKKNINLKDYMDLLEDQAKFEKALSTINTPKGKNKLKRYHIPEELQDIWVNPYAPPLEEMVRDELKTLMEECKKFALDEYITFYEKKTYASSIYDYTFDRYLKDDLKKFVKDWCFKFNYANAALKKILEIKKEAELQDEVVKVAEG